MSAALATGDSYSTSTSTAAAVGTTGCRCCVVVGRGPCGGPRGLLLIRLLSGMKPSPVVHVVVAEANSASMNEGTRGLTGVTVFTTMADATAAVLGGRYDAVAIFAENPEDRLSAVESYCKISSFIFCFDAPLSLLSGSVRAVYQACQQQDCELVCGWHARFLRIISDLTAFVNENHPTTITICHNVPETAGTCEQVVNTSTFFDLSVAVALHNDDIPVRVGSAVYEHLLTSHLEYGDGLRIILKSPICPSNEMPKIILQLRDGTSNEHLITPEMIQDNLAAQINHFLAISQGKAIARLCKPEHCIATARIMDMVSESLKTTQTVSSPNLRLLQIGTGNFGTHVLQNILPKVPSCEVVAVASRTNSQLELDRLLLRTDINCVYICTPYVQQPDLTEKCLRHYKKTIVSEKPLLNLPVLCGVADAKETLLIVAFHRRFDREFSNARAYLHEVLGTVPSILIESLDTTPVTDDIIEVFYSSVVDDLDLISWFFDDIDCDLKVKSVKLGPCCSITVCVEAWLSKYDSILEVIINYRRNSPTYKQHVSVNGRKFGYEVSPENRDSVYDSAYMKMFEWVSTHIPTTTSTPKVKKSAAKYCRVYLQTHTLLSQAVERVADEQTNAITEHVSRHNLFIAQSTNKSEVPIAPPSSSTAATATTTPLATTTLPTSTPTSSETSTSSTTSVTTSTTSSHPPMEAFAGVAGHGGMLLCGDRIYKPLVSGNNEWCIYNQIRDKLPELEKFIPKMYDHVMMSGVPYIIMRNVTEGYLKPRVLDLKVGEPSDMLKVPGQPYGTRVAGYTGGTISRHAVQTYTDIIAFLKEFIKDKETNSYRYELIPKWLARLRELKPVLETQTEFRFRAASLLFVYDSLDNEPQKPMVYLIDLGRAQENSGKVDHMFCFGLRNAIRMFEEMHSKFTSRHAIFLCRHGFRVDYEDLTWVPKATYPHDPPLSDEGIKQAEDLALRLKTENIDVIVSSPFTRALHTAKIIAEILNVKYVVEPALAEFMSVTNRKGVPALDPTMTTGPLVDSTYKKVFKQITLENWESMCDRVYQGIVKLSRTYKRMAIVSHRSTFQALLSVILGDKFKKQLQFCSITSLLPSASSDAGWAIDRLNSYAHLRRVLESPEHNPNYQTVAYKDMIVGADGKILPSGWN
ncbi:phosphoglycerate mutase [Pelomyxa schiedti]|nr:phosphoglycerate mutase [Pelomyxa schiedti]